ncbi:OLC1v1019708C1 [Oldenlandia corymbosa var. corymbosa]|uniref:Dirigent protein n=1 Tax=Oldenlandia corymbosa var. corymbosa TaxID=529605 RepID=A0AAV1EEK1_OLDCO|nr:OLC1v1019708C1 [Oldenlandia corymbosa var. corymbosa]
MFKLPKLSLVTVLLAAVMMITMETTFIQASHHHHKMDSPEPVDEWFEKLSLAKPQKTKLHVYIHDLLFGKNQSIVPVARANGTSTSPTEFGLINVVDDPLTLGPDLNSTRVGRVEGVYVSASQEVASILVAVNFVFTDGKYKGSTLSVLGRIPKFDKNREFPVLGGSGFFRLAQGVVTAAVLPTDKEGNHAVECQFKLVHY